MNANYTSHKPNETQVNKNFKFRLTSIFDQPPPRVKTSSSPTRSMNPNFIPKYENNNNQLIIPTIVTNYNIQNINTWDVDKLKEELILVKNELNKRSKEHSSIKISYTKLEAENKRYVKIIEEVLEEASKQKITPDVAKNFTEQEVKNAAANISGNILYKLKDSNTLNCLRRQILENKITLESKEEEIILLRNTAKVLRYQELDTKMKNTKDELNIVSDLYARLKNISYEKEIKLKEVIEERDYYKAMMARIKNHTDENKEKLQNYLNQNEKLADEIKKYEEKNKNFKLKENSLKNQLKEKEIEMAKLINEIAAIDSFRIEKEKIEKSNASLNKNLSVSKEENEKKIKRIKDLEKQNLDYKTKFENLVVENKRISESLENQKITTGKYKDKKNIQTEEDNKKLKDDLKKLNMEIADLKNKNKIDKQDLQIITIAMASHKEKEETINKSHHDIYDKPTPENYVVLERDEEIYNSENEQKEIQRYSEGNKENYEQENNNEILSYNQENENYDDINNKNEGNNSLNYNFDDEKELNQDFNEFLENQAS